MKRLCFAGFFLFLTACGGGGTDTVFQGSSKISIADLSTSELSGAALTNESFIGNIGILSDGSLYSATVKFKINKQSDSSAYFSDVVLERCSKANHDGTLSGSTALVSAASNLLTSASFGAVSNTLTIEDEDLRYLDFVMSFDNTSLNGCPIPASITGTVVCTKDFSSCGGGDDANYIVLFQKGTSIATCDINNLIGSWNSLNFSVSSGDFVLDSTSTISVKDPSVEQATFTGNNSVSGAFSGVVALNDENTCGYLVQFDQNTHALAGDVDAAFLLIPGITKDVLLGYDFYNGIYFAMNK